MEVSFFCPRWGFENTDWDIFLKKVKKAGYIGVEWFPFGENCNPENVIDLLEKYNLKYSIVMTVLGDFNSFEDYLSLMNKQVNELSSIGKNKSKPLFISAQIGREYFTKQQINNCIEDCEKISQNHKIPIYHETHRNKWTYACHLCKENLETHPNLVLTLDISHWFCVSESYLEDQQEAVNLAISRSKHIHARVGYTQGAQVPDPRIAPYNEALKKHLEIWDKWIENQKKIGAVTSIITPEFGPPPYLTNISNKDDQEIQWELNLWIKDFLDKRYNTNK
jgi:hypothetical protein